MNVNRPFSENDLLLNSAVGTGEIQRLVELGACVPLRVTGSSMLPFLFSHRDTVWLSAVGGRRIAPGDVLLYVRANGSPVLHRVRRLRGDGYLVMNGDAQDFFELIPTSAVIARVEFQTLRGGKKRRSCRSPLLRLLWLLWYPTVRLRPVIFRLAAVKNKLFKKGND